jgi:hypothetical protein
MMANSEVQQPLSVSFLLTQAERCLRLSRMCMDMGTARDLRLMSEDISQTPSGLRKSSAANGVATSPAIQTRCGMSRLAIARNAARAAETPRHPDVEFLVHGGKGGERLLRQVRRATLVICDVTQRQCVRLFDIVFVAINQIADNRASAAILTGALHQSC